MWTPLLICVPKPRLRHHKYANYRCITYTCMNVYVIHYYDIIADIINTLRL